ncbi:MAG: hypothetical protein V3T27_03115 [Alphaproteobacteria bacterium]
MIVSAAASSALERAGIPCFSALQRPLMPYNGLTIPKKWLTPKIYAFSAAQGNDHLRPGENI